MLSICFVACKSEKTKTLIAAEMAVQIDAAPGECSYLTEDAKGRTVLSWVRMINGTTTAFCYAVSTYIEGFPKEYREPILAAVKAHCKW